MTTTDIEITSGNFHEESQVGLLKLSILGIANPLKTSPLNFICYIQKFGAISLLLRFPEFAKFPNLTGVVLPYYL